MSASTHSQEAITSEKSTSSQKAITSEEGTSSKEGAPNVATENDTTGTTGIKREALLKQENEYLMKKITEELTTWNKNSVKSAHFTLILLVISAITLFFGSVLLILEETGYRNKINDIIFTSVYGTGGSVTLLGSLAFLKNLFQYSSEGIKEFEKTLESFTTSFQEPKKDGLNKHMNHMTICRCIIVSILSFILITSTIASLIFKKDEEMQHDVDNLLAMFSSNLLLYSISVMITVEIIIPSVTEKMLDPDYQESFENYCLTNDISEDEKFKMYNSTISLEDLLGFLYYRIRKEPLPIKIIDSIKCITFLSFSISILIGLISIEIPSFKVKIKRISAEKIELEGINRAHYGLPLKKNRIGSKNKRRIRIRIGKKFDELLELDKELGSNRLYELNLKLNQSKLAIKLLQKKRKKESDQNKRKDLDLNLKQKKVDHDKIQMKLLIEKNITLNVFKQKELKVELERIKKQLELKFLKKELELEDSKQQIDPDLQNLKLELELVTLNLIELKGIEMKLIKRKLEIVKKEIENLIQLKQKNKSDSELISKQEELLEIVNEEIKDLNLKLEKLLELEKVKEVEDAIEQVKDAIKNLDLKNAIEKLKNAIKKLESEILKIETEILKKIEKLDLKISEELRTKLKQYKLKLVNIKLKEIESKLLELKKKESKSELELKEPDSELELKIEELKLELKKEESDPEKQKLKLEQIQKLKLEQIQKLKLELKQKALELVRKEIKSIQDKLDSEKYEVESKLVKIKKNSKEIDKLKSDSRLKKIELVKKEIEWTQKKLKLVKKKMELKLESQLK
ncbi:10330_t:CDS:2, partial [Gigaspora rosea]